MVKSLFLHFKFWSKYGQSLLSRDSCQVCNPNKFYKMGCYNLLTVGWKILNSWITPVSIYFMQRIAPRQIWRFFFTWYSVKANASLTKGLILIDWRDGMCIICCFQLLRQWAEGIHHYRFQDRDRKKKFHQCD